MRKLVYYVAVTLDGFIADVDGGFDSFLFEGDHAGWLTAEYPEALPTAARPYLGLDGVPNRHFDTVLMGRATYQVPGGLPSPYAHLRQFVVSSTLTGTPDDVEVIDTVDPVRALKAQDGKDIWLCGGGKLASALAAEIDELRLKIHPIVLGRGIPLFDDVPGVPRFTLTSTRSFDTGVVFSTYARSAEVAGS
ncbi:dihydrofolate reductase family protein [Saccharothrix violaceirubra]|uniref:Dihydrofolate reductase n=1 Tax=Saccharothrix violaceirubra TaxID=413306 RepID=A0A7W7SXX9_9PSEU|nr:dihydrofolate reductase family protein [Saccharothrix violaceirubra]MBB4962995.1 dihydrofolate reductase [Saccharothrix violaceirubra]